MPNIPEDMEEASGQTSQWFWWDKSLKHVVSVPHIKQILSLIQPRLHYIYTVKKFAGELKLQVVSELLESRSKILNHNAI